jgi:DNA-binding transcriptional LysR family regulator
MNPLEFRHVRAFLAVAEHLHFARAADALDMAPPALTRQIQEAERLLGVRLFDRSRRAVTLTAAGEAFGARRAPRSSICSAAMSSRCWPSAAKSAGSRSATCRRPSIRARCSARSAHSARRIRAST